MLWRWGCTLLWQSWFRRGVCFAESKVGGGDKAIISLEAGGRVIEPEGGWDRLSVPLFPSSRRKWGEDPCWAAPFTCPGA